MDDILRLMIELLPAFCDAWQGGRVSRWLLVALMVGGLVLPGVALAMESLPVVRALLFGAAATTWVAFMGVLMVGCQRR